MICELAGALVGALAAVALELLVNWWRIRRLNPTFEQRPAGNLPLTVVLSVH